MNVYASATASTSVFKAYVNAQTVDQAAAITQANLGDNPQGASIMLDQVNLNIQWANEVMGLILKSISSLQP